MRRSPLWALSLLGLALAPTPALAAKTWSTPQAYSTTREVFGSQRGAMAADGTAFAIGSSDLNASSVLQDSVDLGVRTPAGTVTHENHVVGTAGFDITRTQIAVDPVTGDAVAIWCESFLGLCSAPTGHTLSIKAYYRPAGGAWTALADVLGPTSYDGAVGSPAPALAMGPDGSAYVVFTSVSGDLMIAKRLAGNGNFGAPATLWSSGGDDLQSPAIAIGADGSMVVAFQAFVNSGDDELRAIHAPIAGPITGSSTLETLTGSARASDYVVAADPTNGAVVAWLYETPGGTYATRYAYSAASGSFAASATADADTADYQVDSPSLAIDSAKRVRLGWGRYATAGGSALEEAVLPHGGGALSAPATIASSTFNMGSLGLAGLSDGSVLATWDVGGDAGGVYSALSQTPGAWGSPVLVQDSGIQPTLVAGPAGGALATFSTSGNPPDGAVSTLSVLTDPLSGGSTLGTLPPASGGDTPPPATTQPPTTTTPPATTPPDTTAPSISQLTVAPNAFRVARGATAVTAAAKPRGTKIRLAVSEAGSAVLSFTRLGTGIKQGRTCKPGKPGKGRKPCTLRTPAGSLTRALPAGSTTIAFSGRIGTKALPAGRYELRAVATDAPGNASKPRTATFKVLAG